MKQIGFLAQARAAGAAAAAAVLTLGAAADAAATGADAAPAAPVAPAPSSFQAAVSSFFDDIAGDLRTSRYSWTVEGGRRADIDDYVGELVSKVPQVFVLDAEAREVYAAGEFDQAGLRASIEHTIGRIEEFGGAGLHIFGRILDRYRGGKLTGRDLFVIDHLMGLIAARLHRGFEPPEGTVPLDPGAPRVEIIDLSFAPDSRVPGDLNVFRPFPRRWLRFKIHPDRLKALGVWSDEVGFGLAHRALDPVALCVRGPRLSAGAKVWVESVEKPDRHLTVTLGHTGERYPWSVKRGLFANLVLDMGTFAAGEHLVQVRFLPFEIEGEGGEETGLDPRGRPLRGVPRAPGSSIARVSASKKWTFFDAPPATAPPGVDAGELQRRVDAASNILVIERLARSGVPAIQLLKNIKGAGWYPGKEGLYKTVEPALHRRPEEERSWVVFLPWREDHPPLPANPDLVGLVCGLVREPDEWLEVGGGWSIGLRPKTAVVAPGGSPQIEIFTRNGEAVPRQKLTYSFRAHAHYPLCAFEVTTPAGQTYRLRRLTDRFRHGDFPEEREVAPGGSVIETVSLGDWSESGKEAGAAAPLTGKEIFAEPGDYRVRFLFDPGMSAKLREERTSYLDH